VGKTSLFLFLLPVAMAAVSTAADRPNVLILLTDQWRTQSLGYMGNQVVQTPNLDRLAANSVNFTHAVSGMPVCTPYAASLITGQRPLTHGLFMNDVLLPAEANSIAEVYASHGYDTGYVGKWHMDGNGRERFIPRERRQGFEYWKVLECTHNYPSSFYYADGPEKLKWEGYDAIEQSRDVQNYLRARGENDKPFLMILSWGPPHAPYHTAPAKYRAMYKPEDVRLRPNVPEHMRQQARKDIAGYYAHCTALDDQVADIMATLEETGQADNTIVVFTSDHGDLLGSQGAYKKQQPYDESIRVPLLFHYPAKLKGHARRLATPVNVEDVMPTLLGLSGLPIPDSVEGIDFSGYMTGGADSSDGATVITCVQPFGQWNRFAHGAREYRGVYTGRYTYTRDLTGPWLLFDNQADPYQQNNLINKPEHRALQDRLDQTLTRKLSEQGDRFERGEVYLARWGYEVDATGTVPYRHK
jgi:arylsulfatase A-like enzyme